MTIPTLSDDQRRALGRLIWAHVDGVTANVHTMLNAINRDLVCGVRVVATQEWEKANAALHTVQDLLRQVEEQAPALSIDQVMAHLRELGNSLERRVPTPATKTPVY